MVSHRAAIRALSLCVRLLLPLGLCFLNLSASEIPAGQVFEARLETHLASYGSAVGDPVRAVLTAPVVIGSEVLLPVGSRVHGEVTDVRRIGRGWVRERASLSVSFTSWEDKDGVRHPLQASLIAIDNAREQVSSNGEIKGILAAGGVPGLLHGTWARPQWAILSRATRIAVSSTEELAGAPVSMGCFFAGRLLLVRWPEPEIHYAPGTDLRVRLTQPLSVEPSPAVELEPPSPALSALAQTLPVETTRDKGQSAADVSNLLFVGSRKDLTSAFAAAGWNPTAPLTRHSAWRIYRAFTTQHSYPEHPVSMLLLDDQKPEFVFQKSLNSMSKRHHVRVWSRPETVDGQRVWLAAATHDTAIEFSRRTMLFTHQIDTEVDRERSKVVNDLSFVGCRENLQYIDRPAVAARGDGKSTVSTDGRLAVFTLKTCASTGSLAIRDGDLSPAVHGSRMERAGRRVLLEARNSVVRGHLFYWGYRLGQVAWNRYRVHEATQLAMRLGTPRPVDRP